MKIPRCTSLSVMVLMELWITHCGIAAVPWFYHLFPIISTSSVGTRLILSILSLVPDIKCGGCWWDGVDVCAGTLHCPDSLSPSAAQRDLVPSNSFLFLHSPPAIPLDLGWARCATPLGKLRNITTCFSLHVYLNELRAEPLLLGFYQ